MLNLPRIKRPDQPAGPAAVPTSEGLESLCCPQTRRRVRGCCLLTDTRAHSCAAGWHPLLACLRPHARAPDTAAPRPQVELAVLTDEQRALLLIGVHPFPFNGGALAHAIDYHLLASLDASFPWAGAPQRMTMARWRLNRRGAGAPPSHTADSQGYVTA